MRQAWTPLAMLVAVSMLLGHCMPTSAPHVPDDSREHSPSLRQAGTGLEEAYSRLPLSFEPNHGQTDAGVDFVARGQDYTLFLTPAEVILALRAPRVEEAAAAQEPGTVGKASMLAKGEAGGPEANADAHTPAADGTVLRLQLVGGDRGAAAVGHDALPGRVNYGQGGRRRPRR